MNEHLWKVQEVAVLFRVDPSTVRRWIREGSLAAISFPEKSHQQRQSHRIKQSAVDAILASRAKEQGRPWR